ncbi:SMP-30/gluconolactonase/LRE family protein [Paenibacillus thermotolerans]|uniref:SMP-30/gluconolactonase/LRE family protein n=1 Tax=Paenibacillus thermotolerans TaxID=3027807 RepID=UPI0023681704|nr:MULTISPECIES: SMP-30/gluconolactonase/LRE family protein [unclassified Paenibacillus]
MRRVVTKMRSSVCTGALAALLALLAPAQAWAETPYEGYTWNNQGEAVHSVNGYMYVDSIEGTDLPTGAFNNPEDIFIASDETLYIADTGNSRVIHMDANTRQVIKVIGTEEGPGMLSEPKGVYVKNDGTIYVADTKNHRVAVFDSDGKFTKQFTVPKSALLGPNFAYSPSKIILDKRDYMFVISDGNTQGLMQIDQKGEFKGFYGANHVGFSWKRLFIKLVATKEQKQRLSTVKPLAFSNVDQDRSGFIYTTTFGEPFNQVKRLSPVGVDTLNPSPKRYGDRFDVGPFMTAQFADITVSGDGLISALDLQTSKVFQYDKLGNLLFAFGGTGDQNGLFVTPSSVDQTSDGTIYVADKGRNRIDRFRTTPFADLVHEASRYYVDGRYQEAESLWLRILELNANYDMAYFAIGKSLYKSERYKEAMEYFQLAHAKGDYSAAFREYRKEFTREHFTEIAAGIVLLILLLRYAVPNVFRAARKGWRKPGIVKAPEVGEGDVQ